VRIRCRNPCFFFRFRLFGWKVRFTHGLLEEGARRWIGAGPRGGGGPDRGAGRRGILGSDGSPRNPRAGSGAAVDGGHASGHASRRTCGYRPERALSPTRDGPTLPLSLRNPFARFALPPDRHGLGLADFPGGLPGPRQADRLTKASEVRKVLAPSFLHTCGWACGKD
jgi:hypothetical protein